ncbi:MAG: hypothetical protein KKF27_20050, partial [Gammaproteobacteria bacterium]|nr:hypothetical protein [Gammaproteobacteria bacterium]
MPAELLLDKYPVLVSPRLATLIGLNEAIVLQQIQYWLVFNEENESLLPKEEQKHLRAGRWWTFNSAPNWRDKNFPFWSERTIQRTFTALRKAFVPKPPNEDGKPPEDSRVARDALLITGNFNRMKYDRTLWYTINYEALAKLDSENPKRASRQVVMMDNDKLSSPIPDT